MTACHFWTVQPGRSLGVPGPGPPVPVSGDVSNGFHQLSAAARFTGKPLQIHFLRTFFGGPQPGIRARGLLELLNGGGEEGWLHPPVVPLQTRVA